MSTENNNKTVRFSWLSFWVAGWLFTMGFTGYTFDPSFQKAIWIEQLVLHFVFYCSWPLYLGIYLKGG